MNWKGGRRGHQTALVAAYRSFMVDMRLHAAVLGGRHVCSSLQSLSLAPLPSGLFTLGTLALRSPVSSFLIYTRALSRTQRVMAPKKTATAAADVVTLGPTVRESVHVCGVACLFGGQPPKRTLRALE